MCASGGQNGFISGSLTGGRFCKQTGANSALIDDCIVWWLMQQNKTEEEILSVLNQYGDQLAAESEIISEVFHHLKLNGGRVVRKDVILCLIAELESTSDVVRLDVLRGALEIVVGCSHESDND